MRRTEQKMLARELRKNATPAEKLLWKHLRNLDTLDGRFIRQKTIHYHDVSNAEYFFIADFYCARFKLVVELDGDVHLDRIERDKVRDGILRAKGMKLIRFRNDEVFQDMNGVLAKIRSMMI